MQRETYQFQVKTTSGKLLPQGSFKVSAKGLNNYYELQPFTPCNPFSLQLPEGKFHFEANSENYRPTSIIVNTRYKSKYDTIFIILEQAESSENSFVPNAAKTNNVSFLFILLNRGFKNGLLKISNIFHLLIIQITNFHAENRFLENKTYKTIVFQKL